MKNFNFVWKRSANLDQRISFPLLIFLILASNFLNFSLTGNEEHYLALSKAFFEPNWIYGAQNLSEMPGTRLVYQYMTGGLLSVFTFEQTAFIGRLSIIVFLSFTFGYIYRWFEFSISEVALHLAILFISHQSFLGNEWILLDFEPKQLAYIFVFCSLICYLRQQYYWSIMILVVACYFHVLVGGWWGLAILGTMIREKKNTWALWKGILLFLLGLFPIVIYLFYFGAFAKTTTTPIHPDWIYAYFRAKHHLGIFASLNYFIGFHLRGVILLSLAFLVLNSVRKEYLAKPLSNLIAVTWTCLLIMLIGVIVAFFDRTGVLLKFYPFRLGAMVNFMLFVILILSLKKYFITLENKNYYILGVLILFFFLQYPRLLNNAIANKNFLSQDSNSFETVAAYIADNTLKHEKVLYLDHNFDGNLSFHRLAKRERFVVKKFVPAQRDRLYPWYQKVKEKERLLADENYLIPFLNRHPHDYLLTIKLMKKTELTLIYRNTDYFLYRVDGKDG